MFCPQCGKQLPDGAKFCSKCGTAFSQGPTPAPGPATQGPQGGAQGYGPGAGQTAPGAVPTRIPGIGTVAKGGAFSKGKMIIAGAAAVVVIAIIAIAMLLRGGGKPFYQVDRFLASSPRQMLSELERHQGLKYKGSYDCWSGKPGSCPFDGRVRVYLYDDDGDAVDADDLEDGDKPYRAAVFWESVEVDGADPDDPEEVLETVMGKCGLGKPTETDDGDYYASAIGETTIAGEPGFWFVSVYRTDEDKDDYSVSVFSATFDTMDFDDIDDAIDWYGL